MTLLVAGIMADRIPFELAVFLAERRYEGSGYFIANAIIIAGIAALVVGAIIKWRGKK